MKQNILKKTRVFVAAVFFIFTTFIFIDFNNSFPGRLIDTITWLQFVPSLISFLYFLSFSAIGFILILLLTLIFGRAYCSTICPLGTLQDINSRIFQVFRKKRRRFHYKKPKNILRFSILSALIIAMLFGSILLLNLLDPFSNFGKIASNLFRPVIMYANNAIAWVLELSDNYSVPPVGVKGFQWLSMLYAGIFLLTIIIMSAKRGRLFCNTICPVGSLLGIVSKYSLFRIELDKQKCNSCGLCSMDCKAGCIDSENKTVDMSRCVLCFNCLGSCKSNGVYFRLNKKRTAVEPKNIPNQNRRFILGGLLTVATALTGLKAFAQQGRGRGRGRGLGRGRHKAPVPIHREHPVSPPGSISLEHFNSNCTACHLCVSACPTQVLTPAFTEYGLNGFMQPRMNFIISFCNYECTICTEVCPTGAILPQTIETKKEIQTGIAIFVKDNCIVKTEKKDCGACSEHCPTKAVDMILHRNGLFLPEVTPEICVGCGACEHACPTDPKAIYVDGNPIHKKAEKPTIEAIDNDIDYEGDFPF